MSGGNMPYQASDHTGNQRPLNFSAAAESLFQRGLLDSLPAAAYVCDTQGLITYFNRQASHLWGREPRLEDPNDRFCGSFRLFEADGSPLDREHCWMALALKEQKSYAGEEVIIERPDGERLFALAYASPLHDDEGRLTGAVNVLVDVSAHKRCEESLREADRSKNTFLATLAHELRNPLAPLRNAAEILHLKAPPTPELQWAIEVIDRQMHQMTRLVDDLLDLGRITSNKFTLRRERVELNDVLRAAVEISQPFMNAKDLQLSFAEPDELLYTQGDATRLIQVVVNLLHNAAKYTEPGGQVWLRLEASGADAAIVVRDTGIGISPQLLPKIFDLFAQAEQSPDWSPGGLGIGLTLAKQVVNEHDGNLAAYSDGHGQGSEFVVTLPLLNELPGLTPETDDQAAAEAPGCILRILVVDDDKDIADSFMMLLQMIGHEAHIAHDGHEAMHIAEALQPDVMVLDIGMPKLNGYDAARMIRQQAWGEDMILIAFTGWCQDEDRQRAREAGFNHHLTKPVDPQALMKLLFTLSKEKAEQGC
jgi:PAS domain S-box-containing protein